jgi:hypothetical protein
VVDPVEFVVDYSITCHTFTQSYTAGDHSTKTVTYSGDTTGYSFIALNRQITSFNTEPVILDPSTQGVAAGQVQGCNGEIPSNGIGCYATGSATSTSLYTRTALPATTGSLAKASDSSPIDTTTLFTTTAASILQPFTAGNIITGEVNLDKSPCALNLAAPQFIATVASAKGEIAAPFVLDSASTILKKFGSQYRHIPHGCPYTTIMNGKKTTLIAS